MHNNGHLLTDPVGRLIIGFGDGVIRALVSDGKGGWSALDLNATVEVPVSFVLSQDGTVYVLSLAGSVYRLDPT